MDEKTSAPRHRVRVPRADKRRRATSAPPRAALAGDSDDDLNMPEADAQFAKEINQRRAKGALLSRKEELLPHETLLEALRAAVDPLSAGLLDLRQPSDFLENHFVRSVNLPVLAQDLVVELPQKLRRFSCVVTSPMDQQTLDNIDFLNKQRYNPSLVPVPRRSSPNWDAFWSALPPDLVESGRSNHTLFKPTPGLERLIGRIESSLGPETEWTALDLGSGAGRDAHFLVSRHYPSKTLWRLTGVDHLPRALRKATALLTRHLADDPLLPQRWTPVAAELRRDGSIRLLSEQVIGNENGKLNFWESRYSLVSCARFVPPRAFWPTMANLVRPGGFMLINTFLEGTYHPINPDNFLYRGELRKFLGSGWTVEVEEEEVTDEGKLVVVFLARKLSA